MHITDPIADMLTRIRNANSEKHDSVDVPASNLKKAIAQILLEEGYIKTYQLIDDEAKVRSAANKYHVTVFPFAVIDGKFYNSAQLLEYVSKYEEKG